MEDANLDQAVDTLIDGAMFNAGQCCCGIERIYVTATLYDAFVQKAVAIVSEYKLGNPLETETTLGPMANVRFATEVRAQTAEAIASGAGAYAKALELFLRRHAEPFGPRAGRQNDQLAAAPRLDLVDQRIERMRPFQALRREHNDQSRSVQDIRDQLQKKIERLINESDT